MTVCGHALTSICFMYNDNDKTQVRNTPVHTAQLNLPDEPILSLRRLMVRRMESLPRKTSLTELTINIPFFSPHSF